MQPLSCTLQGQEPVLEIEECIPLKGPSLLHSLLPVFGDHCGRKGGNIVKARVVFSRHKNVVAFTNSQVL